MYYIKNIGALSNGLLEVIPLQCNRKLLVTSFGNVLIKKRYASKAEIHYPFRKPAKYS
jgi:hypothetical protein